MGKWGIEDSAKLYGINKWGADYFTINGDGDVVVTPFGRNDGPGISLHAIAREIEDRLDISVPLDRIAEVETIGDLVSTVRGLKSGG